MKSFHHTWLLCVFQSIWIFFLPDQSASVWLPSWIQLRGHPGGSICWDVMWCDVSPFFSCQRPAACIFPPHFHPSSVWGAKEEKKRLSWNSQVTEAAQAQAHCCFKVFEMYCTHKHTLTTWCRSAITQLYRLITNHCSAAATPGCCCCLMSFTAVGWLNRESNWKILVKMTSKLFVHM